MKLIIAGGRDYKLSDADYDKLDTIKNVTEVVSGGATGADKGGEEWAYLHFKKIKVFKADWKQFGRAAGPIRNEEMARYADAVALFPGGRGTASMFRLANKYDLEIYDYRT